MAKYACSDEGVQALNDCASRISEGGELIRSETNTMRSVADEYAGTIGPHQEQLKAALDEIAGAVNQCIEPANNIAEMLQEVADGYQEVIDSNPFGAGGN